MCLKFRKTLPKDMELFNFNKFEYFVIDVFINYLLKLQSINLKAMWRGQNWFEYFSQKDFFKKENRQSVCFN